jgi:hypothetical protein
VIQSGWTTNMPLEDFLTEDLLVAFLHDGEPIPAEHGGPARLIVPRGALCMEERQVGGGHRTAGSGSGGLLRAQRVPYARGSVAGGAVRVVRVSRFQPCKELRSE